MHLADKHLAAAVGKLVGGVTPGDTVPAVPPTRPEYLQ